MSNGHHDTAHRWVSFTMTAKILKSWYCFLWERYKFFRKFFAFTGTDVVPSKNLPCFMAFLAGSLLGFFSIWGMPRHAMNHRLIGSLYLATGSCFNFIFLSVCSLTSILHVTVVNHFVNRWRKVALWSDTCTETIWTSIVALFCINEERREQGIVADSFPLFISLNLLESYSWRWAVNSEVIRNFELTACRFLPLFFEVHVTKAMVSGPSRIYNPEFKESK